MCHQIRSVIYFDNVEPAGVNANILGLSLSLYYILFTVDLKGVAMSCTACYALVV